MKLLHTLLTEFFGNEIVDPDNNVAPAITSKPSIKLIKYDQDDCCSELETIEPTSPEVDFTNPSDIPPNDNEQIFSQFAQWLIDNGMIKNSQPTNPLSVYDNTANVLLQDEEQKPIEVSDDLASLEGTSPGEDQQIDPNLSDTSIPNDEESEDPDRQGMIRTVPNAHLVYKRKSDEGQYEELWIYQSGKDSDAMLIKRNILAGTDIDPTNMQSEDGSQTYELWPIGNAHMLKITGLPN